MENNSSHKTRKLMRRISLKNPKFSKNTNKGMQFNMRNNKTINGWSSTGNAGLSIIKLGTLNYLQLMNNNMVQQSITLNQGYYTIFYEAYISVGTKDKNKDLTFMIFDNNGELIANNNEPLTKTKKTYKFDFEINTSGEYNLNFGNYTNDVMLITNIHLSLHL
jgi:hypothetical protein